MGEGGETIEKSAVGAGEGGRVTVSPLCTSAKVPSTITISPSLPPPKCRISVLAPLSTAPSSLLMRGGLGVGVPRDKFLLLVYPLIFEAGFRIEYASASEAERACFVGSLGRTAVILEAERRP